MPAILQILTAAMMIAMRAPMTRVDVDTPPPPDTTLKVAVDERFRPVIERLVKDGWERSYVEARFADSRVEFIPRGVTINVRKPASADAAAYGWMYTDESVEASRAFVQKYATQLAEAERKYGVDRHTIAALLRCETRHGSVTGSYHVFSIFASTALMPERNWVDSNIRRARTVLAERGADEKKVREEIEYIRNRAIKRGGWAYRELISLLRIEQSKRCDAMGLKGSWAGAFGWSQFLPSSYMRIAVDGNSDGRVDLFDPADAIHSTANYLQDAGYRIGDNAARRKAIRSYNQSTPYVESIVSLGDRVATAERTTQSPAPTPGGAEKSE